MPGWAKQNSSTEHFNLSPGTYWLTARGDFHGGAGQAQLETVGVQSEGSGKNMTSYTPVKQSPAFRRGGHSVQRVTIVKGGLHRINVSDAHLDISIRPAT